MFSKDKDRRSGVASLSFFPVEIGQSSDTFSMANLLKNQKGMSLVEVMLAAGIMIVIGAAISSLILSQAKETKSLSEILAALDLEKNIIASMADGSVCQYMLTNPSQSSFNSMALPQKITSPSPIYAKVTQAGPGPIVAKVGDTASTYSSSMIIKSIKLEVLSGSGTSYTGRWLIEFDETKSVRAHKPISVSTTLSVDSTNPTAAKFVGCMTTGVAQGYMQTCPAGTFTVGYGVDGIIQCQAPTATTTTVATTATTTPITTTPTSPCQGPSHMTMGGIVCDNGY